MYTVSNVRIVIVALLVGTLGLSLTPSYALVSEDRNDSIIADTLSIEEVEVIRSGKNSDLSFLKDYAESLQDRISRSQAFQGIFVTPISIGVVFNVNAIYDRISGNRKKNFRHLSWSEREWLEYTLDEVWIPLTVEYSGLDSIQLDAYQINYRPDAKEFVALSNEERIFYLLATLKEFKTSVVHFRQREKLIQK